MRPRHHWLIAILLFLASCTVAGAAIAAQLAWEEIVGAAEKEGEVTVYATNSVRDLKSFGKPFVKNSPRSN
jgi:hypothetical protein